MRMASQIEIECRVQYKRPSGEWFTLDEAGKAMLIVESDLIDLLARWVGWFEAKGYDVGFGISGVAYGLCQCCLQVASHAPDCLYAMSGALLDEATDG